MCSCPAGCGDNFQGSVHPQAGICCFLSCPMVAGVGLLLGHELCSQMGEDGSAAKPPDVHCIPI